jgi:uncharacterized membrane protein HdeD (DUF308 family)
MDLQSHAEPVNPRTEEYLRLHRCWLWFLILGIALVVVGLLAISADFLTVLTTLTTMFVLGVLLIAGGVVQIVNAFLARSWRGFFLHLLAGALHLVVGELMIEHPLMAAEALTLLLAAAFLVGGAMRIVVTLFDRFPGWGWVLLNGVITFLLGVMIWRQWPESSLWVIGLFVGIDLIFSGWSWVMLGLLVKGASPTSAPASPAATALPAGRV